jgi:hypothetical protein
MTVGDTRIQVNRRRGRAVRRVARNTHVVLVLQGANDLKQAKVGLPSKRITHTQQQQSVRQSVSQSVTNNTVMKLRMADQ